MEIKTKFDLGQQVYRKKDGKQVIISNVTYDVLDGNFVIWYLCRFDETWARYLENELTETPKPKSVFELGNYDEYFYIDECGDVKIKLYTYDGFDKKRVAQGNAFLTADEAEKEAKRREIHQWLKKLANGYEFKPGHGNYFILFNSRDISVLTDLIAIEYEPFKIYFKSEQDALNAIKEIGEDVLIRDYFGYELQA